MLRKEHKKIPVVEKFLLIFSNIFFKKIKTATWVLKAFVNPSCLC